MESLYVNGKGECIVETTVPERQFPGELDLLDDRASLVSSRAGVAAIHQYLATWD